MLSDEQRRRLEQERDSLQQDWDTRNDKLMRIRKTLAIETDPSSQFKYEQQIKNEAWELKKLTDRLDEIERQLQSVEHKANITQNQSDNSDLINKILLKAEKVTPEFLYKVPEIEGYSKAEVVNEIYEMVKDGYLEALPLHSQASQYPEDFQNIKITRRGRGFLRNQHEGLVQQQKILILAAIPHGLRLDKEMREIRAAIERAARRDLFEIKDRTAVRPADIRRAIAEEQPQIVHFCGHGLEDGSLLLEDEGGNNKPVSPEALASLFKLHVDYVKCVLLNACYSEKPAQAISQYIDYVIGMNQPIEDKAAIAFAQGFYDGLGYKNSGEQDVFQRAFNEGIVAIEMENLSQGSIPVLKKKTLTEDEPSEVGADPTGTTESKNTQQSLTTDKRINKVFIFTVLSIVIIVILFVIIFQILHYPASKNQFTDFQFTTKHKTEIIPISNPIYRNLEKLLKIRKFEEADQETFNLMRSIAKLKNNEINFDGKKDILTFDCEALHTIDMLWTVNSNNYFGFSIQSQMWIEEGGKLGIYDDAETSDRFANLVGWDVKKKSFFNPIAEYSCQFNEEKKGNLPCKVNVHIFKQGVPYIVERLKSCGY